MKGIFFLIVFGLGLLGLSGCYTIPRHYVTHEIIVYYPTPPPPEYYPPDPEPWPIPDPTYPRPTNPPPSEPYPPRDRQPEQPKDSYDKRDQLQGGNHRGRGEIKTDPPVRTGEQKDRGQQ